MCPVHVLSERVDILPLFATHLALDSRFGVGHDGVHLGILGAVEYLIASHAGPSAIGQGDYEADGI